MSNVMIKPRAGGGGRACATIIIRRFLPNAFVFFRNCTVPRDRAVTVIGLNSNSTHIHTHTFLRPASSALVHIGHD